MSIRFDAQNKYRAKKTTVDGHVFPSQSEANRYIELRTLQQAGEISGLELQVCYPVVLNGQRICKYYADFVYLDKQGVRIVEDRKGMRTPVYKLKKKLVEALYGISITET